MVYLSIANCYNQMVNQLFDSDCTSLIHFVACGRVAGWFHQAVGGDGSKLVFETSGLAGG
jgi:hypothetical protein